MKLFAVMIAVIAFVCIIAVSATPEPTLELTKHTFYDYIQENQDKRVFVKFYAPWCGHCKNLAPVWDQLQEDNEDLRFVNLNCDENKETCREFNIQGYPTLKLFHEMKHSAFEGPRDADFLVAFAKSTATEEEVAVPLPPLVRELIHDLNEIWAIRRNALGVITLVAFLVGAIFSCMCCTRTKIVMKEKKD